MMKSQLFYIYNYTTVKVRLVCWWCCVCCIVLLMYFLYFLRARHDHNTIAPRGMIKVFLTELNWIDFGDVWVNQGVGDEKAFLKEFKEKVLSQYRQEWDNSIKTKERFTVYNTFKSSLSLAPYLNER